MKHKVGDRVKIKSIDWYNKNKDRNGYVNSFTKDMAEYCGSKATIAAIDNKYKRYRLDIDDWAWWWTEDMFEEIMGDEISFDTKYEWKHELECPEGYQFKDENGAIINSTKIVLEKKKKEYPKTYEECCKILDFDVYQYGAPYYRDSNALYYWQLVRLQKLLVCRNAYWMIAGEEMGLGKSWKPDWTIYEHKFCIGTNKNKVVKECLTTGNRILAFPTEEMRDAFKENFDPDIEICKELL